MLEELRVRDYALIETLEIELTKGFNVLTGETGAGKSIMIGALGLLLGDKGDGDAIRTGAEEAEVSGVFHLPGRDDVHSWLDEKGIAADEERVLIRRTVKNSGRGQIFIQSSPVTKQDLRDFTSMLVDVHGQHQHQSLLSVENHRKMVDRYAGCEKETEEVHGLFTRVSAKRNEFEQLVSSEKERLREIDILQFSVSEIEKAALKPGEEEELEHDIRLMSQHEKIFNSIDEAYDATAESKGGALSLLRQAMHSLKNGASADPGLNTLAERLETAFYEIEDISQSVREYRSSVEYSPEKQEVCEERLALIHNLEKKYGNSIPEIIEYMDNSREKLNRMENWEENRELLQQEIRGLEKELVERAGKLSLTREKASRELEKRIETILRDLGMPNASFSIQLSRKENSAGRPVCGAYGFDNIEFLISPNKGEPLKPIRQIASGGEISRIMLAIKSVLSETDTISTLIFDEIDVGIGGEVALNVGEHLNKLAGNRQVLCVTHLASIAVRADNHVKVEKKTESDRTVTLLHTLDDSSRVREIARMLSGDTDRGISLEHAEEMLREFHHLDISSREEQGWER